VRTNAKIITRAILLLALIGVMAGDRSEAAPVSNVHPELIIDGSVAKDFQALALQTWERFLQVFWNRKACFGDVTLKADKTLSDRAVYDPSRAVVTVRVPATAAMLRGAMVHEWAHHLEFQCKEHQELRTAFLIAQGLPVDTPWRAVEKSGLAGEAWEELPSEQYAEATIALVLGRRSIPTGARITTQAVEVIENWAVGELR
jgi:hypothetical protein